MVAEKNIRKKKRGLKDITNKKGMPLGAKVEPNKEARERILQWFELMLHWTKESAVEGYVPYSPMTLKQAAEHLGKNEQVFFYHINTYPELKERYEAIKVQRREIRNNRAESILDKALWEKMDMDDDKVARLALDVLKATDKAYNPKIEIDQNVKGLHLHLTDEEIMDKIKAAVWM